MPVLFLAIRFLFPGYRTCLSRQPRSKYCLLHHDRVQRHQRPHQLRNTSSALAIYGWHDEGVPFSAATNVRLFVILYFISSREHGKIVAVEDDQTHL